jgi:SpoVK/Ycf46/Vps4 family AAA+-type ATPase
LEHYAWVVGSAPSNVDALRGASSASEAAGEGEKAAGYRRLLHALGSASMPAATDAPVPEPRSRLRVLRGGADASVPDELPDDSPPITLSDVGGMAEVKRRLEIAFLAPLRNPELRRVYGKSLRGGALLYGPPGCGKTFLARALAGEIGARFYSIGIPDVMSPYQGESEQQLHQLFETARRNAPALMFFDEIDALGHKRSQLRGSVGGRNVVNVLLAELDGIAQDNEGLFVLAATNHPWDVDTALRRPGRFDRMVLVLPPDTPAREFILRYHLRDRPAGDVDLAWVASHTDEFSGADLAHLCESATELALEQAIRTGRTQPVTTSDFKRAMKEIRPSVRSWFDSARNYAMFANEGGTYDELVAHIKLKGY